MFNKWCNVDAAYTINGSTSRILYIRQSKQNVANEHIDLFPSIWNKTLFEHMFDSTALKIGLTFMCEIGPIPTLYQEMPW